MHLDVRYLGYPFSSCFKQAHRIVFALLALVGSLVCSSPAQAQVQELLLDGGFEGGGVGWQVSTTFTASGSGGWFLSGVGSPTPLAGLPTDPDGGGVGLFAITDQAATGDMALLQAFMVPNDRPLTNLILAFDMFINDWSFQTTYNASQHARVDIITATSAPRDVGTGVVFNAYLGTDGGPLPNEFRHYEFDVLPFLTPGTSYRVRFQTTVRISQLNQGVDNVSLLAVPEPTSGMLATLAAASVIGGWGVRRRRA